jgi:hypothetical protein
MRECLQITGFPPRGIAQRCHSVDTRLIQCWHVNQQTQITGAAHVLIDDSPGRGAFSAYLSLSVTEVHVEYVYTESASAQRGVSGEISMKPRLTRRVLL